MAEGGTGDDPFTSVLVGFARELRAAGLRVGTGDVLTYFAAMTPLDPTDLVDLYWAGRATLLQQARGPGRLRPGVQAVLPRRGRAGEKPAHAQRAVGGRGRGGARDARHRAGSRGRRGAAGPRLDGVRRGRAQAPVLHRVHAGRARRPAPDHDQDAADAAAPPDPADQARPGPAPSPTCARRSGQSMRMHGEPPGQLFFRKRKTKLRPLILILDVSGSMADYSRHLLQFAHTARPAVAPGAGSRCSASAPG